MAPPLPSLLEQHRQAGRPPARVRLTTLFVDVVGSTRMLAQYPAEQVLGFVQRFMRMVTEVALAYRSDVKDFERADPGGIVASQEVVEALEREAPELAACARPLDAAWVAPDGQGPPRATYTLDDVSAGG